MHGNISSRAYYTTLFVNQTFTIFFGPASVEVSRTARKLTVCFLLLFVYFTLIKVFEERK